MNEAALTRGEYRELSAAVDHSTHTMSGGFEEDEQYKRLFAYGGQILPFIVEELRENHDDPEIVPYLMALHIAPIATRQSISFEGVKENTIDAGIQRTIEWWDESGRAAFYEPGGVLEQTKLTEDSFNRFAAELDEETCLLSGGYQRLDDYRHLSAFGLQVLPLLMDHLHDGNSWRTQMALEKIRDFRGLELTFEPEERGRMKIVRAKMQAWWDDEGRQAYTEWQAATN